MAIEKLVFSTVQDVANAIDGLEWFDSVTANGNDVSCMIDGSLFLKVTVGIQGSGVTPSGVGVSFYTKGYGTEGGVTCAQNWNGALHKFAFRTKNGILFASHSSVTTSQTSYFAWMLAKTNNGKIAVVLPGSNGYNAKYKTAAVDETSSTIPSDYINLNSPNVTSEGTWEDAVQLIAAPIPTHPASGTSYIKNAMGFLLCPRVAFGKMLINNVEYATNGTLALSDED